MFIKFKNQKREQCINLDKVISIVLDEYNSNWCIRIRTVFDGDSQGWIFRFISKMDAEQALDKIFRKEYQDNTLLIFDEKSGFIE